MRREKLVGIWLAALCFVPVAFAQSTGCVPMTPQQLIIYRAGSLSRAFNAARGEIHLRDGNPSKG